MEDLTQDTKFCIVCGEKIKAQATVCIECNNYQDWSRYIFRWSGMVAAVVGLFPLWTIGFSLYEIAFPSAADLKISVLACNIKNIDVAVFNDGKQSGLIQRVDFKVLREPDQPGIYRDNRELVIERNVPIKQGDVEILKLLPSKDGSEELPIKKESQKCKYKLDFNPSRFSDEYQQEPISSVECDCAT